MSEELWKNFDFMLAGNRYKCQTKRNHETIYELYIDGKNDKFHYRDMNFNNRNIELISNPIILEAVRLIKD